jgi:ribonuclease P protein component
VLYVAPNGLDITRVGISTSKRLGKAVTRNRVKRLIRESVRAFLPSLPGGRDLVFVARPASAQADYQSVRRAVEILLERAHLLSDRTRSDKGRDTEVGKEQLASEATVENEP